MISAPFKRLAAAALIATLGLHPAFADTFLGAGARFDMTQECSPGDPDRPYYINTVRMGYAPGQTNGGEALFMASYTDGIFRFRASADLVASPTRQRGHAYWMGYPSEYRYQVRPRIRVIQQDILQPEGETDIANATEIFVRFRITRYWDIYGCAATYAGVLRNANTATYLPSAGIPDAAAVTAPQTPPDIARDGLDAIALEGGRPAD